MSKPIKTIKLHQEVLNFLQSYAKIEIVGDEDFFHQYTLPQWKLKYIGEPNKFEVIVNHERFFFVSYNGVEEVPAYTPEGLTFRQKTVIGHLAFSSQGFPSMLFITEQLIPERSKVKVTDVVITLFHEFNSEQDFDDFTVGRNMNDQLDGIIGMN